MNTKPVEIPYVHMKNSSIKGIIFDMDGTIITTTYSDYLAWKILFEKHGRTITYEEYVPLLGIRSAEVIQKYLGLEGDDLATALYDKLMYFENIIGEKGVQTVPFVEDFIKQAKQAGLFIALATSSRREKMEMVMKKVNLLHFFDAIVTGEEIKNGKPAPDIFLEAASRLSLNPEECIVIEDAGNGVKAAKSAQIKCIAITTTHESHQLSEADLIIDSYNHLNLSQIIPNIGF